MILVLIHDTADEQARVTLEPTAWTTYDSLTAAKERMPEIAEYYKSKIKTEPLFVVAEIDDFGMGTVKFLNKNKKEIRPRLVISVKYIPTEGDIKLW
jgi:hypothetical protein